MGTRFEKLVSDYQELKSDIEKAILKGAKFMFDCMDGGRVPSEKANPTDKKAQQYGFWPAAEMANFLLVNQTLPNTCSKNLEEIIDHLIDNFKFDVGVWPSTENGTTQYLSAQMTGSCTYVLKLYHNEFLDKDRREQIENVIAKAESYLVDDQHQDGHWLPSKEANLEVMSSGVLFYSYHAYLGIKALSSYRSGDSSQIERAQSRAQGYFQRYAEYLIKERYPSVREQMMSYPELLAEVSKVLQVLNDFDDDSLCKVKSDLRQISAAVFDTVCENKFKTSSVTLTGLPEGAQSAYTNNTPYDVYFSLREDPSSASHLIKMVKEYLGAQDSSRGYCWFIDFDHTKERNTWPTIEALLVLSDAYDLLTEEFYLREMQQIDNMHATLDAREGNLKAEEEKLQNNFNAELAKRQEDFENTKKDLRSSLWGSLVISTIAALASFVLLILGATMEMNETLKTFMITIASLLFTEMIAPLVGLFKKDKTGKAIPKNQSTQETKQNDTDEE